MSKTLVKEFKESIVAENSVSKFVTKVNQLKANQFLELIELLRLENLDFLFVNLVKDLTHSIPKQTVLEHTKAKILLSEYSNLLEKVLDEHPKLICLKGLAMEELLKLTAYKRRSDVDIIVSKSGLNNLLRSKSLKAFSILKIQNYGELTIQSERGLRIDVHYDLLSSSPFTFRYRLLRNLNNNIKTMQIGNINLLTFDLEFNLMYLILHFVISHNMTDFILFYEISRLIVLYQEEVNIAHFITLVKKHNAVIPVSLVLLLLQRRTKTSFIVDSRIANIFLSQSEKYEKILDKIERQVFRNEVHTNTNSWNILSENLISYLTLYLFTIYLYILKVLYPIRSMLLRISKSKLYQA